VIDFDHNATTSLDPRVAAEMARLAGDPQLQGNPSSIHGRGRKARATLESARRRLASAVGAGALEVTFTGSGSESDALAILGSARALRARGKPSGVLSSRLEHPAVGGALEQLRKEGHELRFIEVDERGAFSPEDVAKALADFPEAGLVSLAVANHELGNLYDVAGNVAAVRSVRPQVLVHADAVQALGKVEVDFSGWGLDLMSLAAHKIGGPKGMGALIHRSHIQLAPLYSGGHQERGRRPGTEDPIAAHGFAVAAELARDELAERRAKVTKLRERLVAIIEGIDGARVLGTREQATGNTALALFEGCKGELILMNLDLEGIWVSTGSACSAGTLEPSKVLLGMGLEPRVALGAVRFSLGPSNTDAELDRLAELLPGVVERVRKGAAA
jgi:cysteine desulfurase